MSKSLWGDLPKAADVADPGTILREQATELTEATRSILLGKVTRSNSPSLYLKYQGKFIEDLSIVAPVIQNYTYKVVTVAYDISSYPAVVIPAATNKPDTAEDEEHLRALLADVFQSDTVRGAIAALLARST